MFEVAIADLYPPLLLSAGRGSQNVSNQLLKGSVGLTTSLDAPGNRGVSRNDVPTAFTVSLICLGRLDELLNGRRSTQAEGCS